MSRVHKAAALILAAAICLSLCGCGGLITDSEQLLSPPALTGEMKPIYEALSKSVKSEYALVYPSAGDMRSPIALKDVDGDGKKEAFAFYSVNAGDLTEIHINYIKKIGEKWKSVADSMLEAGGIEKIEFCDLNGDGGSEILVGFKIYGDSEKKLGVYSAEKNKLLERLVEAYTGFICCDLDGDGKKELFSQILNTAEASNTANIYTFSSDGFGKTAGCMMDGKVKSVTGYTVSKLKNGGNALFVDEEKGAGSVTEVLIAEGGELKNPLLDGNKGENIITQRTLALTCTDINGDGLPEIPTSIEMPLAASSGEKAYYTNWCGFDGETLTVKTVTVMNQTDGYYLLLPTRLFEKIALSRDSENRSRTFYLYDKDAATVGKRMFTITAVNEKNTEKFKEINKNAEKIGESGDTEYYAEVYAASEDVISISDIKEMFKLTE